jgi:hypothetical protein
MVLHGLKIEPEYICNLHLIIKKMLVFDVVLVIF